MRQSDRLDRYKGVLRALWDLGLIYPCTCTRRDITEALSAPQEGTEPAHGPDGLIYPGTCRHKLRPAAMPEGVALRLDMAKALARLSEHSFTYCETGEGAVQPQVFSAADLTSTVGDIVLSRKDFTGSYHLSVVLDDADQGISDVIRGRDLQEATRIHVVLQHVLGLPVPRYHHHRLIRDETGKRLAKRDDARALTTYRAAGQTPEDVRNMLGLTSVS